MARKPRQQSDAILIAALAAGETVAKAARSAGFSDRTAHRRMSEPEFRDRVDQARSAMLSRTVGIVSQAAAEAALTLQKLLKSDSDSVRLGASRALLENLSRLKNDHEFEQRLSRLEYAARAIASEGGGGE